MPKRLGITAAALIVGSAPFFSDNALAQVKRAKGFVREPDTVFQTFPVGVRFRNYLPPEVDLSNRFPVPGNQGQQSSCTAWAVGYAMRSYYEGKRQNWSFASSDQLISPAFIYNSLQETRGDCSSGIAISAALNLLQKNGAPTLALFPYSENSCTLLPDPAATGMASEFRIRSWRAIDSKALDDAKGQIRSGNPVVFGMDISDSFENLSGDVVYDDVTSPRTGGHAMVLVGYSERRQAFKLINSWGTDWGDKGFGWVSYRAVKQFTDRMFVMDVPDLAPAPDPVAIAVAPQPSPAPVVVPPPKPAPVVVAPAPEPAPKPAPVVVAPPPEPAPRPAPVVTPPAPVVVVAPKPAPVVIAPSPEPAPKPTPVVVAPPEPRPPVIASVVEPAPKPSPAPPAPVVAPKPAPPKPVVVAPPKPVPAPAPPPVATVQKQIAARLNEVSCARLEGTVSADRTVRVRGFAGDADELAKLREDLLAMPGVRRVESEATLRPWPQCEVYLSFAEALAEGKSSSVRLRGGNADVFREGDSLSIEVVTPAYPSYLYVSYLQANGEVAHLAWPQGRPARPVAPNTRITFGGGNGQPVYRVGGPFGDEMVVVVASASPLFQEELPETADDRQYLTTFRKAFLLRPQGGGGQRTVSAVAVPLKTQPAK